MKTKIAGVLLSLMFAVLATGQSLAQNTLNVVSDAVTEGKEWNLTFSLTNATQYVSFQTDLAVPAGVTLKEGSFSATDRLNGHTVTTTTLSDGTIRVIAYNATNTTLLGSSGTIFTLTLVANTELTGQDAKAILRNARFTDAAQQETLLEGMFIPLQTPPATAIETVRATKQQGSAVYDLQGRRVSNPRRGAIYIIGGRKTIF